MPLRLDEGWNQIHFNLADFNKRAYGTNYVETLRIQVTVFHDLVKIAFFLDKHFILYLLISHLHLYLIQNNSFHFSVTHITTIKTVNKINYYFCQLI